MFTSGKAPARSSYFFAGIVLTCSLSPARAEARRFYRARFQTETLELEEAGEIEIATQLGGLYGDGDDGSRLLLPDFEVDVGVCKWLEIDVQAALLVVQLETAPQLAANPIWLAARVDAYSWKDEETGATFGVGLQAGPRLPFVTTPLGVGFAALGLVGGGTRDLHVAGNLGTIVDYGQDPAITFGVDAEYELNKRWSLLGNVAAAHYFGDGPEQYLLAAGAVYKPQDRLALSALAIAGPFIHGDRAGALFGVSYSLEAWGHEAARGSTQSPQVN